MLQQRFTGVGVRRAGARARAGAGLARRVVWEPLSRRVFGPAFRRWFGLACGLGTALAVPVQAADLLPAERFFQHPQVLAAQLSPSGRQVAVTSAIGTDTVQLLVLDVASDAPPRRVAGFRDADIVDVTWASDTRLLYSVRDLAAGSGRDLFVGAGLMAVNADGSDAQVLVRRRPGPVAAVGDVRRDRALSVDHRLLWVPAASRPGPAAADTTPGGSRDASPPLAGQVVVGHLRRGRDGQPLVQPLWLDTRSGLTREMNLDGAPPEVLHWWFDSQGTPRVARTERDGRATLHWRGPADAGWRVLVEAPVLQMPFEPLAVADDGTLYLRHDAGPRGEAVLGTYDPARQAPAATPLLHWPGYDVGHQMLRDAGSGALLGHRGEAERERSHWFTPRLQRLQQQIDAALPERVNSIDCRRCEADDLVALVSSHSDRDPGQLYLYTAATGQMQHLGPRMGGIDPAAMARVQLHPIRARDGLPLPVWLTVPAGATPGRALPAVVLAHGGPWLRGGHWRWEPMAQFLASRGWLVISPDFRGSTGYGQAHLRAGFRQWGRAMQDDLADALRWARREGLAGPQACIIGGSYGGYATLMGLVRDADLYRCGAAWAAVSEPLLLLQSPWWLVDDSNEALRRHRLPDLIGDAEQDAGMLAAASPLRQAAHIRAPLLLAHGGLDRRVPPVHAQRLREALGAAGHPPEWLLYDDEGHGWRRTDHRVDFAQRLEVFLRRHLDTPVR
ncbi:alpha/beta hydrolase family protein [Aquabacterium sp. OR-4]|uniref:alpha/beta hydrolase family protein n=1 Tax=Aquabacterium sp. OR-4 TaxID=2978127 RepID=UPI0028C65C56|nr:alpha/beta fold hydrolase [Aquabacterium sp. OR-4]MDT7837853.1 alpha/beta fold hydrolase [Aquabacterium sp. OR-4]